MFCSTIIPTIGRDTLRRTVCSVLDQTLTDWELILVDDGTTDGATAIARNFAAGHPDRISVIEHPERRLCEALKLAASSTTARKPE